jgi:type I restriction enzyme M protein
MTAYQIDFENELWQTAVNLRGTVAPAEYKRFVLPLLFMRYLSLRYDQRRNELERLIKKEGSDYHTDDPDEIKEILADPYEYEVILQTAKKWTLCVNWISLSALA